MPSLRRDGPGPGPPDPVCPRCSKPILPGTATQVAGRAVHMRCVARATRLNAIELRDRARQTREEAQRASEAIVYARELVNTARRRTTRCPACGESFTARGGVLFQGDQLVHAACWREDPKPFDDPPPAG